MSDSRYYINSNFFLPAYFPWERKSVKIYSDKTYTIGDFVGYNTPQKDTFTEVELSSDSIIWTNKYPNVNPAENGEFGVDRTVFTGAFTFKGVELAEGTISSAVRVDTDVNDTSAGAKSRKDIVSKKVFSKPINVIFSEDTFQKKLADAEGVESESIGEYSKFFPEGWAYRPFEDNLVSIGSASGGSGSSLGSGSSNTPLTLTTTSSVDTLTGIKKTKDIFKFDADPSGEVDKVTGFNAKEKDILSISKSAFEIDKGTFAVAKNAKTLAKQLATSVDIVYNRQTGELVLNANGAEPGYGDDGGVFAVMVGRPTVGAGSVQFY